MSETIILYSIYVSQIILGLAGLFCIGRVFKGPRAQDRVLALDAFYLVGMLHLILYGILNETTLYFELALIIGALGFVSTVALAKFLMRGEVIE